MSQWLRKYRVLVKTKSGSEALEVSSNRVDLRCTYWIEKNMTSEPNYSIVTLYNLNSDTMRTIIEDGSSVIVEAGYINGSFGMIFFGEIIQWIKGKEDNVNGFLRLVCQDADHLMTSAFVAKTLSKGWTHSDIVDSCLDGCGKGQIDVSETPMPRARTLFGKCSEYLGEVANSDDATFYVDDDNVNIVAAPSEVGIGFDLRPDTGLVGFPQQTEYGVSGQCLLNPGIKLNTMIHIESGYIVPAMAQVGKEITVLPTSGNYRVNKLIYEGDTRGDPWYITFEAVNDELIEGGAMDAMDEDDGDKIHVALPGIIEEFDPETQTVKVQLAIMEKVKQADGSTVDQPYPILEDVPLWWPRAGGYNLIMPIEPGDECLVVFCDLAIDSWWQSGGVQAAPEARRHDLSDGICLLGTWSQPRKIKVDWNDLKGARLQTDDAKTYLEVRKTGMVYIKGSLTVTGSTYFGTAPDEAGEGGSVHERKGKEWKLEEVLDVQVNDAETVSVTSTISTDNNTPKFNINGKEFQDHTNGGLPVNKYY